MVNIPQEQLRKRFQLLPESLQIAIFSEQTAAIIRKSCNLRDISVYQVPTVAILVGRVLLGYLRPENFAMEIQKETGIELTKAQLVTHDIDTEIFSNVRLELKKLYPPMIQTPTVQSWKSESGKTVGSVAKPKYVIPIPEKFMKRETWNIRTEAQSQKQTNQYSEVRPPTTNNLPPPQPQKATNSIVIGGIQRAEAEPQKPAGGGLVSVEPSQQTQVPQKPEEKIAPPANSENLQANFKPVVPLPTFIRSQFRAEEPQKTTDATNQKTEAKAFAGKFSAPDPTVAKPPAPKEDQYREKV